MHEIAVQEVIENWTFTRCVCGWLVAESPSGLAYWVRAGKRARLLPNGDLTPALKSRCRIWDHEPDAAREKQRANLARHNEISARGKPQWAKFPAPTAAAKPVVVVKRHISRSA